MEGKQLHKEDNPVHAAFWMVIVQIVVLDAVFSLDSVIAAVGMVKELSVMMVAVVIAVGIMLWASRPSWTLSINTQQWLFYVLAS